MFCSQALPGVLLCTSAALGQASAALNIVARACQGLEEGLEQSTELTKDCCLPRAA